MTTDLTLAGAGLLGAIVGAGISSFVAKKLDDKSQEREARQEQARVRASAAFVRADLQASRRRFRETVDDGEWLPFYRLPTSAWREHGPTIAPWLRPDDVEAVAYAVTRIEDFERAMAMLPIRRYGFITEGAPRPIPFDDQMLEKVREIASLTDRALSVLEPLALHGSRPQPDGRSSDV